MEHPWISTAPGEFNLDLGFSQTDDQARQNLAQTSEAALPPIVASNAAAAGTDLAGYFTESPGFTAFVRDADTIYHTYTTTWRGLVGYYPILDRVPKGRDEGHDWQTWLRRHDDYGGQ